ncbi:MAG: type VI secretion system contractile sheath large subunit [Pseudomonadota bacterium]
MAPEEADEEDTTDDALASLPDLETDDEDDGSDDILTDLADAAPDDAPDESSELDDLLGDLADMTPEDEDDADNTDDVLSDLADVTSDEPADESSDLDDLLGELADMSPEDSVEDDATDDILAAMPEPDSAEAEDGSDDILDDLITTPSDDDDSEDEAMDDILGDLTADDEPAEAGSETDASDDVDLGDLLADDDASDAESTGDDVDLDDIDLDDLLGDETASDDAADGAEAELADIDLDDLLGGTDTDSADAAEESSADDLDLDDLLSDDSASDDAADDGLADLDLDDALGDLDLDADDDAATDDDAADDLDLDDLFADSDSDGGDLDLDDAGDSDDQSNDEDGAQPAGDAQLAFGRISADRPDPERLKRTRFRIAIFGDFSGRAARGQLETGDALAARKPILLDPDTVEDVIQSFATTLVLPIGKDGAGIEVKLGELDDLHPDELYENVELFDGLSGLKGQLSSGATADHAAKQLMSWGEEFGQAVVPPRKTSGGNTVRADLKLSDFQKLIGDTEAELAQASPVDDLLKRIVGPHIHKLPSPDVSAMQTAVDEALSAAMRTVLHHPEFQSVEAQWRSLDLIARSVEDDDTLDVILYDVSAEEIAADLAAEEDLAKTGLVRLLTEEPLDEENGRGGYSALVGLYTFEETPPHAELLGRIGRVAAHVDAPFISAITPAYLDIKKEDRHPLVVKAWDTLRAMPEAGHVALASPRFLLRRPYGAKSEPIYEFDFEEFTETEGLRGMLWANPAVLVTILLARSFKQNGKAMKLGSVMSLGGVPYHYVNDRYGDQVALPCTERNITLEKHEHSVQRGYMPVLSVKGRDEIRLGSFNSVAGREILGPWSGIPVPEPSPDVPPAPDDDPEDTSTDDDLDLDLDLDSDDSGDLDFDLDDDDLDLDLGDDDSGGLDDFLAGFGDDSEDEEDDEEMDPELAALLADL